MKILEVTSKDHEEIIAQMRSFEGANFEPQLGIFWYDTCRNELFGVNKLDASSQQFDSNHRRTYPKLHKDIWRREEQKARFRNKPSKFIGDYTQVPRGRIFQYEDGHFEIMVGDWIDKYPSVIDLIIDEFDLPQDAEVVKDVHWNIGRGWSDEVL